MNLPYDRPLKGLRRKAQPGNPHFQGRQPEFPARGLASTLGNLVEPRANIPVTTVNYWDRAYNWEITFLSRETSNMAFKKFG